MCVQQSLIHYFIETLYKAYMTSSIKICPTDWKHTHNKGLQRVTEIKRKSGKVKYTLALELIDYQAITYIHSQYSGLKICYAHFSLKKQRFIFNIDGFPISYFW